MGYLPPEDFMASFKLGIGRLHFEREAYDKAIGEMEQLLEEFPGNDTCAEAVYWLGVSKYKDTGDPAFLKKAYETLKSEYPKSEWTRKAQPYSLI
jgi:TolA-binding protein